MKTLPYHPLLAYHDAWGNPESRSTRKLTTKRRLPTRTAPSGAWVNQALAWMRQEYERSAERMSTHASLARCNGSVCYA